MRLHPVVERAAAGELPAWAEAGAERRDHMFRVQELLDRWAAELGLPERERTRWRALAYLHDVLRDADPAALRRHVAPELSDLPGLLLHGPAAAHMLRCDGVRDAEVLQAVAFHTLGHPELTMPGEALYAADFLEPGRDLRNDWRDDLRERMPQDHRSVVREICAARVAHLIEERRPVRRETVAFWNSLVEAR